MKNSIQTKCFNCERNTNQRVLFTKKIREENEYDTFYTSYMTLECGGCKNISFLIRVPDPNALPDENQFFDSCYPRDSNIQEDYSFLKEDDQEILPSKVYFLYEEIKNAFKTESNTLAGLGLRTLVESICLQQKIPGRNLKDKIRNLHNSGLISAAEILLLDKLRIIGNQSTHQGKSFSIEKLAYALDVVNHIIQSVYVLPKINKRLKV